MLHKVFPNEFGFALYKYHKNTKGSKGLLEESLEDIQLRKGKHTEILYEFPKVEKYRNLRIFGLF